MSLLPAYMSDAWNCYEQMSREDLSAINPELVNVSPELCHANVLPFLAWEAGINISGFSEAITRSMIRASINAMAYAGTTQALKESISSLGLATSVTEWFDASPHEDAYTFSIIVGVPDAGYNMLDLKTVETIANRTKNARSQLSSVGASLNGVAEMPFYACAIIGYEKTTLYEEVL
ncbi:MAG TPA: phage tail protein I [Sulfurimonas sp. UBA12504]|nr:MAG TPA: phage tail protein I [Sulfurimonas sp. UBA12504]